MYQRFHVRFRLPAMRRGEFSAATTQLMSKCLWSEWKWWKGNKEIASPCTWYPVNREYSWKKSQIEKKRQKKAQNIGVCGWRASWIFHHGGPYYTETSPLICRTNHWTGFYTTRTSVMKELMFCYLHVFIEIYSLIMTK